MTVNTTSLTNISHLNQAKEAEKERQARTRRQFEPVAIATHFPAETANVACTDKTGAPEAAE